MRPNYQRWDQNPVQGSGALAPKGADGPVYRLDQRSYKSAFTKPHRSFLATLRAAWFGGFTLLFLLGLDQFYYTTRGSPEPKYFYAAWVISAFVLFLPGFRAAAFVRQPLVVWSGFYLALSLAASLWADDLAAASNGLKLVLTTASIVLVSVLAFPRVPSAARWLSGLLWVAIWAVAGSVAYDLFLPGELVPLDLGPSTGIVGRGGGLLLNPNSASAALVVLQLCIVPRLQKRFASLAVLICFVGIVLTFSRGGLIAWAVMVALQLALGKLPKRFGIVLLSAGVVMMLFADSILASLFSHFGPSWGASLDRIGWMLGRGGLTDYASLERESAFRYGVRQFWSDPIFGHGLGYSWVWGITTNTHNVLLRHAVEYGLAGLLIYPGFLFAMSRTRFPGVSRTDVVVAGIVAFVLGIFSHNLLEQAFFLIPLLCISLIPIRDERQRQTMRASAAQEPRWQ